jgi:nitrate reductase gamma subunit
MSGVFWLVFTWGAIAVLLIGIVCRILVIARLPIHLRWELAPIPHEKAKGSYGGSYLEEYEWWKAERKTSAIAPLLYMGKEIFLLRSVWKHNRSLWPFSFAMHWGIYLLCTAIMFHSIWVVCSYDLQMATIQIGLHVAYTMALCGYLLGAAGTIGLLLKRVFDPDLRWSSDTGTFFNLFFLAAIFVSGAYAWFGSADAAFEVSYFISRAIAFMGGFSIAFPLALHIILLLLFCVYLPFTGMIHFVGKFFTFHEVLWNDKPLDGPMERRLGDLLSQKVDWEAKHARAGGRKSWAEIAKEIGNEETQS